MKIVKIAIVLVAVTFLMGSCASTQSADNCPAFGTPSK
ncbi:MAG: hypothetical protein ACJAZ3_001452 [Sphingobacteriales bacterium]|jgi:hypothetical protein